MPENHGIKRKNCLQLEGLVCWTEGMKWVFFTFIFLQFFRLIPLLHLGNRFRASEPTNIYNGLGLWELKHQNTREPEGIDFKLGNDLSSFGILATLFALKFCIGPNLSLNFTFQSLP